MPLYRDFETTEAIDAQYLPSRSVADADAIFERWRGASEWVRESLPSHCGVSFGPSKAEYLDIFPARPGGGTGEGAAPTLLFLHGGYWRAFSARDFSWLAPALARAGLCVAIGNYALCPKVPLEEIVRQCRAALAWLHANAAAYGGDPGNIVVSGHSAGGHLAAMALLTDWRADFGIDGGFVRGGLAISGLFDLAPFPHSALQADLSLDAAQVAELSPIRIEAAPAAPMALAVGADESAEFHRQSAAYRDHVNRLGGDARTLAVAGANHFTVLDSLADEGGALYAAALDLCGVDRA